MESTSVNWGYVTERVRRYNERPTDDLLYRIGTHCDALTPEDQELIREQQNNLSPEQRFRVLSWLVYQGLEIKGDLALLIFGRQQLAEWLERSRQAYPDFEFYLAFEYQTRHQSGWQQSIEFTMHWIPKPGAPEPDPECDFPWKAYWEPGNMFWFDWMPNGNQFDFNLSVYPNQKSFTNPFGYFCEEGDRYTTLTDAEADLIPLAQVLGGIG